MWDLLSTLCHISGRRLSGNDMLTPRRRVFPRLQGEPVNLREQHDAIEFFISLVDSVDEALKALSQPLAMSRVLGGIFSDQKICKQCPHRCVGRPDRPRAISLNTWTELLNHYDLVSVPVPGWCTELPPPHPHPQVLQRGPVHGSERGHP